MRGVVLGHDHQAGGALVEAMDDAGAQLAADAAQVVDVVEQGVDQRAVGVAGGRMDDHARGLVDDHDVGVLVDDVERQRLRLRRGGRRRRHVDDHFLLRLDREAGLDLLGADAGDLDLAVLDQPLDLRPRLLRQERGERRVEAGAGVLFRDGERHRHASFRAAARSRAGAGCRDSHHSITRLSGTSTIEISCDSETASPKYRPRPAIAAEELDDEPRHRVGQHVAPERAAGEGAAALLEEQQAGQDQRLGARLVELRRVQVDVQRRAGVGERERIGEDDAPRHRRLLAVAAAGEEAADPADDVAEGDARREHVGRRPHRQLVAADVPQRDDHREDQPAVEDAARLRQRQQLPRIGRERAASPGRGAAASRRPAR